MQVLFNNIYKNNRLYPTKKETTMPDKNLNFNNNIITFYAAPVTKPVMSNKIANEKARMLKKANEILKTNIPILDKEQLWEIIERRATAIIRMKHRKRFSHELELEAMYESPYLSSQQKFNRVCEIERERKELDRIDPFEIPDYLIPKPTKENYDYKLIEKFKLALNDNNFDLRSIYQEHYSGLNDVNDIEELREKYPSFNIIPTFEEVITDKIIKTLNRDTYIEFDKAIHSDDENEVNQFIMDNFLDRALVTLNKLGIDVSSHLNKILMVLSENFAKTCAKTINENRLSAIPTISKLYIPEFTDLDRTMSQINYDNFVLYVLREHYLNGKKLNEITYTEGDHTVKLTDLKGSEYKFEKFSENIKKFITDSEKVKQYQRNYLQFTQSELKERLLYYEKTELGYDDQLFNLFAEFESCKFTEEDRNNLIVLLKELDKISDGTKTLEEGKTFLKESNIRPHGTDKINQVSKFATMKKIKAEQQKKKELDNLRLMFNDMINNLYEKGLISVADSYSKQYPSSPKPEEMARLAFTINFINKCINEYDKKTAQSKIARWEIYNDYAENDKNSPILREAINYSIELNDAHNVDRIGQYLLNRELIDTYPESTRLISEPDVLKDIAETFKNNPTVATKLLCRYENYKNMATEEKNSIFKIIKLFDENNSTDKILLHHAIEKDYINCDTSIIVERDNKPQRRTIAAKSKKEVYEKYNFPGSMEFFKKFENALPLDARNENSSGVKKTDKYDKKMDIKYELKIMGHTDRLFACNKDFYFDNFSKTGFH